MDDQEHARQLRRNAAARDHEQVAARLELAAAHLRRTAEHFRNGDIPSACAHVVAARGELVTAERSLDDLAVQHASHASV